MVCDDSLELAHDGACLKLEILYFGGKLLDVFIHILEARIQSLLLLFLPSSEQFFNFFHVFWEQSGLDVLSHGFHRGDLLSHVNFHLFLAFTELLFQKSRHIHLGVFNLLTDHIISLSKEDLSCLLKNLFSHFLL